MKHYFDLTRPGNAVLTAIAVIAGGFIAIGPDIIDFQKEMIICCISAMMLVGGEKRTPSCFVHVYTYLPVRLHPLS